MMERWAEEYRLKKEQCNASERKEKYQMSFEFDMDRARERELNDHLEATYGHKPQFDPDYFDEERAEAREREQAEFRKWMEAKECND